MDTTVHVVSLAIIWWARLRAKQELIGNTVNQSALLKEKEKQESNNLFRNE